MIAARWIAVPAAISLAVIGAILAACAVATAAKAGTEGPRDQENKE
jgi:hypothetical protein